MQLQLHLYLGKDHSLKVVALSRISLAIKIKEHRSIFAAVGCNKEHTAAENIATLTGDKEHTAATKYCNRDWRDNSGESRTLHVIIIPTLLPAPCKDKTGEASTLNVIKEPRLVLLNVS